MNRVRSEGKWFAMLETARPRQWIKNLVPLAVPAAGGALGSVETLARTLGMAVALCLASSAAYFVNDARDVQADREHPDKRHRPVASGRLSKRSAIGTGAVSGIVACVSSAFLGRMPLLVLIGYMVNSLFYTYVLKKFTILDVLGISLGFVLRALAGGVVSGVEISPWFLLVTVFGALFLAFGKRFGELGELGTASASHRSTLETYDLAFLQSMLTFSQTGLSLAFCLWAVQYPVEGNGFSMVTLSIGPFLLVVMRLSMLLFSGRGSDPTELFYRDVVLQLGLVTLGVVLLGSIYL